MDRPGRYGFEQNAFGSPDDIPVVAQGLVYRSEGRSPYPRPAARRRPHGLEPPAACADGHAAPGRARGRVTAV